MEVQFLDDEAQVEKPRLRRNILYSGLTTPGLSPDWNHSADNPLSESFIPLDQRTEIEQARWYHRCASRIRLPVVGEF